MKAQATKKSTSTKAAAKKSDNAKKNHRWTEAQIKWVTESELLGRDYYAEFRKKFKISEKELSDQAIRGRRVAIYKQNGWC